jgi:hypothetical protein
MSKEATIRFPYFAVCVERGNYRIDLQIGKLYRVVKPHKKDDSDSVRVIDDSMEDYLYPSTWFVPVELPAIAKRKLAAAG